MEQKPAGPLSNPDVSSDLRAAVEARRELGPEMEDHVIESFLRRVEERMQERGLVAPSGAKPAVPREKHHYNPIPVVPASLALSIPILPIAGYFAGAVGIVMVLVAIVIINVLYVVQDRL